MSTTVSPGREEETAVGLLRPERSWLDRSFTLAACVRKFFMPRWPFFLLGSCHLPPALVGWRVTSVSETAHMLHISYSYFMFFNVDDFTLKTVRWIPVWCSPWRCRTCRWRSLGSGPLKTKTWTSQSLGPTAGTHTSPRSEGSSRWRWRWTPPTTWNPVIDSPFNLWPVNH